MRTFAFELELSGLDPARLAVRDLVATEQLCGTFAVEVHAETGLDFKRDAVLGKPAHVRIVIDDEVRAFHGLCWEIEVEKVRDDRSLLRAVVVPRLAALGLGRGSRIFQKQTVPEVVKAVLTGAGLPAPTERLAARYEKRENLTQYDESNLAFVSRLLAEEGIGFAVWNEASEEKVVLFDDARDLPAIARPMLLDRDASAGRPDSVFDVAETRVAGSDAVLVRDYDLKDPGRDLSFPAKAPKSTGREVYRHPARIDVEAAGKRRAQSQLEGLSGEGRVITLASDCPRLEPGRGFDLEGHPRAALCGSWRALEVIHRGHVERDGGVISYENQVRAIAKSVPWRPRSELRTPRIGGPQVAIATGPGAEEQHADEFGRVKVRFPWDRSGIADDKSSTWLRVGQLPLSGPVILPRVGFEVLVDFELGDLDRPFVLGHLYNGEQKPPYALPGGATKSSLQSATLSGGPGANEMRFEDAAGGEEIFLNASKDFTVSVEHDAKWNVGNNETVEVGSNHTLSVGNDWTASVGSGRTVAVGASQKLAVEADLSETTGGASTVDVGGMFKVKVGGDLVEECKGTLGRTVAALQSISTIKGYERKVVGNSTVTVGAAWTEMVAGVRSLSVGGLYQEGVGALKLIKAASVSVTCGAAYAMTAASEDVKCGGNVTDDAGAALGVTAGGVLKVKAKNIVVSAENKLVVKGGSCSIELTKDGKVTIKAPTVKLKGVKELSQIQHKTN